MPKTLEAAEPHLRFDLDLDLDLVLDLDLDLDLDLVHSQPKY